MLEKFILVVVISAVETVNMSTQKSHGPHTPPKLVSCELRQEIWSSGGPLPAGSGSSIVNNLKNT